MSDTIGTTPGRWPRDLKVFAFLSALWAAGLTARVVMRDVDYYSDASLHAVIGGMEFAGSSARLVLLAQAMAFSTFAIGIAVEKKWGLVLALAYLAEVAAGALIFMMVYMHDLTQGANVPLAGVLGIAAVLALLYLWIRSRAILFDENL